MFVTTLAVALIGCVDVPEDPIDTTDESLAAEAVAGETGEQPLGAVSEAPPAVPSIHVDFVGCYSGVPRFLISWGPNGSTPITAYDLDIKRGSAAWANLYDGLATTKIYNGVSGRWDGAKVRACNADGCSAFTQIAEVHEHCGPLQ